jgi:hypothetical protein
MPGRGRYVDIICMVGLKGGVLTDPQIPGCDVMFLLSYSSPVEERQTRKRNYTYWSWDEPFLKYYVVDDRRVFGVYNTLRRHHGSENWMYGLRTHVLNQNELKPGMEEVFRGRIRKFVREVGG